MGYACRSSWSSGQKRAGGGVPPPSFWRWLPASPSSGIMQPSGIGALSDTAYRPETLWTPDLLPANTRTKFEPGAIRPRTRLHPRSSLGSVQKWRWETWAPLQTELLRFRRLIGRRCSECGQHPGGGDDNDEQKDREKPRQIKTDPSK